jgi:hypothetical protein
VTPAGRHQPGWWRTKIRQFGSHVTARVSTAERADIAAWLTPAQLALFDRMHIADRRHGLDVAATLRSEGVGDHDVLVAGLLHDCGKGDAGLISRIVFALGQSYGGWIIRAAGRIPGVGIEVGRLAHHAEASAVLAQQAGCSDRTVELIRDQDRPRDPDYGVLLKMADEAN